jgi:hypothetical protein
MGVPNIVVDGNSLDNGSWRRLLGPVSHTMEVSGESEMLIAQFIVQATTKADLITRIQSTETDFIKTGPRVQFFTDTAEAPLYDWTPNDGQRGELFTAVEWVPDESQSVYAVVMSLYITSNRNPVTGAGGGLGSSSVFEHTGQTSVFRLTKEYAEDQRMTVSVNGHFTATVAASGAPMTLTDVENNSGFAKFKVTGSMPTYSNGMRITAAGTTNYNGTHLVTSISGQYFITRTPYASGEAGLVGATAQVKASTSGADNYASARATIISTYLGVEASGAANGTNKRVLLSEHVVESDADGNDVDFICVAGPQIYLDSNLQSGGNQVTRGFDFQLGVSEPSEWFPEAGPKPKLVSATGTFSVREDYVGGTTLYDWYNQSKANFASRVAAEAGVGSVGTGTFKLVSSIVALDYTLNVVKFTHMYRSNWTGTLEFQRQYAESTKLDYAAWSDADGYDVVQRPNRAVPKTVVITTSRTGEGKTDIAPPTPTEGGYTYIEVAKDVQSTGPFITEWSNNSYIQHDVRTYVRFKFKGGSGGATIQQVNPTV